MARETVDITRPPSRLGRFAISARQGREACREASGMASATFAGRPGIVLTPALPIRIGGAHFATEP